MTTGTQILTAKCCNSPGKNVTINVVLPEPDRVGFGPGGGRHEIYGVAYADPVWERVNNPNEPVCYTMKKKLNVEASFWASEHLSYNTMVEVDVKGTQGASTLTFAKDIFVLRGTWPSWEWLTWPAGPTTHISDDNLPNTIGPNSLTFTWYYRVPSGTNAWVTMANTSGPHKIYRVYGEPKCSSSDYTKSNIDGAVAKATGADTESAIASKANDTVGDGVFSGCICDDGFQKNFDAAMGSYPPSGDKGMCCCRAKGLDCALQVLGIGPYVQDFVNELPEGNTSRSRPADQYCSTCGKTCRRKYWDGFWNQWEGVVKKGTGSTCYAPANGSISIDEGTYSGIQSHIASDCGYYWEWGPSLANTCTHLPPP